MFGLPRKKARAAEGKLPSARTCEDFGIFKPLFKRLVNGYRNPSLVQTQARHSGESLASARRTFSSSNGLTLYVRLGGGRRSPSRPPPGKWTRRLRSFFSNGTESNLLAERSLHAARVLR